MTKPVFKEVDFKNSIGQVIKPGDEVVIITSGYNHNVNIASGKYIGTTNDNVTCIANDRRGKYRYIDTKEDIESNFWSTKMPKYPSFGIAPRWGTPEYETWQEDTRVKQEAYNIEAQKVRDTVELYYTYHPRRTTLQRNRIFKIDTHVLDLKI